MKTCAECTFHSTTQVESHWDYSFNEQKYAAWDVCRHPDWEEGPCDSCAHHDLIGEEDQICEGECGVTAWPYDVPPVCPKDGERFRSWMISNGHERKKE